MNDEKRLWTFQAIAEGIRNYINSTSSTAASSQSAV
jgi:hypothetical protein